MPDILRPTAQQPASSWAIATRRQPNALWPEQALIWEATQNYQYARTTPDGRIIFGGEDDDVMIDPEARAGATPAKVRALKEHLKALGHARLPGRPSTGPARSIPPVTGCR